MYSVDYLLSHRRKAILKSRRFRAALKPTRATTGRGGTDPGTSRAWGMLPITASHALGARLVQAGHGSAAIAREVLSAVSMYSLSPTDSDTVFDERVRDSLLSTLSPRELQGKLRGTCRVLLQECKFGEFEGFLRLRRCASAWPTPCCSATCRSTPGLCWRKSPSTTRSTTRSWLKTGECRCKLSSCSRAAACCCSVALNLNVHRESVAQN